MVFLLKLICCVGGSIILAGAVTAFMKRWEKRPIVEVKETPFYITLTYKDIKRGYEDE